jgi:hypothetical protein
MRRAICLAILMGLAMTCEAQVMGSMAEIAIIDRDSGAVLSPHFYRGEYWVAGSPGARYAIEIRNRMGERLLAVTSVDGVNVVSGATAGWDQTGYVFSPGERYQITGWRKTDAEVAAFTFTESPNSYAERTGRPANVGVIGVAIFRERAPQAVQGTPMIGQSPSQRDAPRAFESDSAPLGESMAKAPTARASNSAAAADAKASPSTPGAAMSAPSSTSPMTSPVARAPVPAPKLGTGHGEREYSYVNRTEFSRMQTQPNEVIRIRYDSLDNLFAMGIIKRPRPATPGANPFPASPEQQYVPDPRG